jgi:exodeoxyribonuclease VII large subunit
MPDSYSSPLPPRVWSVSALCRAIGDALDVRFNPVEVSGEISGFTRVASGHCYFSLKDASGQLRCAMFRRAAALLDFTPRDGETVVARARVGLYEPRGDLQLVVEGMSRAGKGALFEQFLRLKAKLDAEGLFDPAHKRPVPTFPRSIGLVTSLAGAALHDVVTVLRRRAPHVALLVAPAQVQGPGAAQEMVRAISELVAHGRRDARAGPSSQASALATQAGSAPIDLLLLVRGGGSIDDLSAFNDETLARAIAACPIPVIAGVGHETDFTIADFVADLRAATPTAAAELAAPERDALLGALERLGDALARCVQARLDRSAQTLDMHLARLARPSRLVARQGMLLSEQGRLLSAAMAAGCLARLGRMASIQDEMRTRMRETLSRESERMLRCSLRLDLMNPRQVLRRGFAWVSAADGKALSRVAEVTPGAALTLQFVDGQADATVQKVRPDQ